MITKLEGHLHIQQVKDHILHGNYLPLESEYWYVIDTPAGAYYIERFWYYDDYHDPITILIIKPLTGRQAQKVLDHEALIAYQGDEQ